LSWVQELESFASSDALSDVLMLKGVAMNVSPFSDGWNSMRNRFDATDVIVFLLFRLTI
jgi:hypothetical protein